MIKRYRFRQVLYLFAITEYLSVLVLYAQTAESIDRLRNKAENFYAQGDYNQALTYYLKGYQLARRRDNVRAANLTVDISSIYHMQGDYRRGATICHEGELFLKQAATQPDSVWFKLNSSLGEMYKKLNNQDSCYLYFTRANTILQNHPELESRIADYVIYHYNNQGMMYVRAGGYSEGLTYLTKALSIAEKYTTSKENLAILQNNLGEVYDQLGLFGKALMQRKAALLLYSKKDAYKYQIYSGASWDALHCGAYKEGIVYAENALALAKTTKLSTSTNAELSAATLALNRLGRSYYLLSNYKQATHYYQLAIKRHKVYFRKGESTLAGSYLGLAYIKRRQGDAEKALFYCQQAIRNLMPDSSLSIPSQEQVLSEQSLFDAFVLKAELLYQRAVATKKIKDLQSSCDTYDRALMVADAMRKSYNALETKWFFSTKVRPAYLQAFETTYSLYNRTKEAKEKERVFQLLERSKAAALTDITRELLIKPANVPASLLSQERKLQITITAQKLKSTTSPSPNLLDAQIQLSQLQQQLEKEFPAYYRAKYQPQTVTLAQVQAAVGKQTAYLSYVFGQDALYIAVTTQHGLTLIRRKGNISSLKNALKTLNAALYTNPGLGNYNGTPAAILAYRWLIEPVDYLLKDSQRLIISGDGDLHRIPFEILETGRLIDDFLVKRFAISYISSANALLNRPHSTTTDERNNMLSLAPFIKPVGSAAAPLSLPYLPASQAEVEQLPGESLLGRAATKRRFMQTYANYNVLHLATHAYANDVEPARSFIAFYPDGNPDKLYAEEIHNLSFPHTRLVVLSACETGNGKLQSGEGVMSLAQAFTYAGCPSIVSTLWSAHDESMAYLSQQLHKYLQAGLPTDVALQQTQLDYFRSALYPKLSHPHYWANFILMGDNRPIYTVVWPTTEIFATFFLVLFVAVLVFTKYKKSVIC